jgi:arylsulfatase A-like enzyme
LLPLIIAWPEQIAPGMRIRGLVELYDLRADPSETTNLWDDPASQAMKVQALTQLCDRMAWTVDPLPKRLSAW